MIRVGSLCSGYGGLDLAVAQVVGAVEVGWWSEVDPAACQVMAAHTGAPNLGDLRELTGVPGVDVVTAGFPCQPVSTAGRRMGVDDDRWIIDAVIAVWRASGAPWLVLENVPGLCTANRGQAFGAVIDSLAQVGAVARWTHLRACDIGAPHRRNRWFCVACHPDLVAGASPLTHRPGIIGGHDRHRPVVADPDRYRFQDVWVGQVDQRERWGDVDRRLRERFGGYAAAVARWEHILDRVAPDPRTRTGRLNPRFVEWMQGLPGGWVTDTGLKATAELRVLGAGVVPQQGAHALRHLFLELSDTNPPDRVTA